MAVIYLELLGAVWFMVFSKMAPTQTANTSIGKICLDNLDYFYWTFWFVPGSAIIRNETKMLLTRNWKAFVMFNTDERIIFLYFIIFYLVVSVRVVRDYDLFPFFLLGFLFSLVRSLFD